MIKTFMFPVPLYVLQHINYNSCAPPDMILFMISSLGPFASDSLIHSFKNTNHDSLRIGGVYKSITPSLWDSIYDSSLLFSHDNLPYLMIHLLLPCEV